MRKLIKTLMLLIGFCSAVIVIGLTSSFLSVNPEKIIDFIIVSGITAALSGITAFQMEKTSKYKIELRKELLDLSIFTTLSFFLTIIYLRYSYPLIALLSLFFFIWGLIIFLLTLIFERLDIYEPIVNLTS